MRVLHFVHWPRSGITTLVKELVDASSGGVRHGVIFIVPDKDECKEMEEAGISVYDISCPGILPKRRTLKVVYNNFQPDIVHLHSFLPSLLHLLTVGNKVKTIRTIHNLYPYFFEFSMRSVIKRAVEIYSLRRLGSVVVGVSDEIIQRLPSGFSSLEHRVILNGIKIPKATTYICSVEKPNNELNLLTVGRLEDQKGYDLLIEAVSKLSSDELLVNVTIIGEGAKRQALESIAEEFGVGDKIHFAGYLANPYSKIDISSYSGFISSSRYEGLCIAVLEAMAHRLPVITTKSGGLSDAVENGWNAIVVDIGAEQIVDGIMRFSRLSNKDRTAIGLRGYEFVSNNYSIQKTVVGYEELYQS